MLEIHEIFARPFLSPLCDVSKEPAHSLHSKTENRLLITMMFLFKRHRSQQGFGQQTSTNSKSSSTMSSKDDMLSPAIADDSTEEISEEAWSVEDRSPGSILQRKSKRSSSDKDNSHGKSSKSVSFSTVTVHCHAMTLGDNPSCLSGPPVCLGHECLKTETRSLEDDEQNNQQQPPANSLSRPYEQLWLSPIQRHDILVAAGFGRMEMAHLQRDLQIVRASRNSNAPKRWFTRWIQRWQLRRRLAKQERALNRQRQLKHQPSSTMDFL